MEPPTESPVYPEGDSRLPDDGWTDAFTTLDYFGIFIGAVGGLTAAVSATQPTPDRGVAAVSIAVLLTGLTLNRSVSGVRSRFGMVPLGVLPVLLLYVGLGSLTIIAFARQVANSAIIITDGDILSILTVGSVGVAALYLTIIGLSGFVLWMAEHGHIYERAIR